MPTSTIPFDPSLVLGMVVDPNKIKQLEAIADEQLPVDLARNKVNALLRQKLSLDMTLKELVSLGATTAQLKDFRKNLVTIMEDVIKATGELSTAVITAEEKIAELKGKQGQKQIGSQVQSPLDFDVSALKPLPISSDSMNMDVQYFRYEDNEQSSTSVASSVSTFVGAKVSEFLGPTYGVSAGASAHSAVDSASKNRSLVGTVVILINCTHKDAQVFSPVKLNVDSAIENFVSYTKKSWDKPNDPKGMLEKALVAITPEDEEKGMPLLVGATYGSSFVGFVHFEQIEKTQSFQAAASAAAQASQTIEGGLFVQAEIGSSFSAQASASVKDLMSTSNIQSHCNVISMGIIPSIKSNNITSVVEGLKDSPKERMEQLAAMQDASNSSIPSVASQAAEAKKGNAMQKMSSDYIKGSVSAVAAVDTQSNKVIDMNSLMTALDDFVERANKSEGGGVPINFYIKHITQRTIAYQWMEKYYPDLLHEAIKKASESDPK